MTLRLLAVSCASLLLLSSLHAQTEDRPGPPPPPVTRTPVQLPTLSPPKDPARVKGTFQVAGKEHTVTDGAFYDTYLLMKPHEEKPERPLAENTVLVHHLLSAEAEALGFAPLPEELEALNPIKMNPSMAEQLRQRWNLQGITEEKYLAYLKNTVAMNRMKDFFTSLVSVTSDSIYDMWKKDNLLNRIAYVEFTAAAEEAKLRASTPTTEELRKFWESSPVAQNLYRIPTSVTLDMVVFDPRALDQEELARLRLARPVTDAEALEKFRGDVQRYTAMVPTEKRHLLHPTTKPAIGEIVTPYSLVKDRVIEEILLGDTISKAYAEVKALPRVTREAMKQSAEKHGLKYLRAEAMSREECLEKLSDFGQQLFNQVFNGETGMLCSDIHYEGALKYFWRLEEKNVSTLPAFEAVRPRLTETYITETAYARAWEAAKEFVSRIDAKVSLDLKDKEAEIDRAAAQKAQDEAARAGAKDAREIANYQNQHRALAENEKRMLRSARAPEYFDQMVKAEGLELKEFGPFTFRFEGGDRSNMSQQDLLRTFFESSFQIKSLEPGSVSLSPMSDAASRTHFLVKVIDRVEPTFDAMSPVDYHRIKVNSERQAIFQSNYDWPPFEVMNRLKWKAR
ncbi:MAG TPA: hypothetical protein PKA37_02975 [Planctomycetota bacterium]|nr:hypothetical protein [Planctomycetota bacterium]